MRAQGGPKGKATGVALLLAGLLLVVGGAALWVRSGPAEGESAGPALAFLRGTESPGEPGSIGPRTGQDDDLPPLRVAKTETCGCCAEWVRHMEESGFELVVRDVEPADLLAAKARLGLEPRLRSCHTAAGAGYVFEGHVPADLVRRVLEERPEIEGLVVPGMPVGSPGMEGPSPEPYEVLALLEDGRTEVYTTR